MTTITREECEKLIGHCWRWGNSAKKRKCYHCGFAQKRGDWVDVDQEDQGDE